MSQRKSKSKHKRRPLAIALYHDMTVAEDFERAAQRIFAIIADAQKRWPGAKRVFYLDIQGHRNSAGGYDRDAHELMTHFLLGSLGPYLTEINTPLCSIRNPGRQRNDLPEELIVQDPSGLPSRYDVERLPVRARESEPTERKTPPAVSAIAEYLGIDQACMICWSTPVERAHVVPVSLGGSMDVRNFALLCSKHHREAPDVADAESFWAWVDYAEMRDGADKWLKTSDRVQDWLRKSGQPIGVGRRESRSFFSAVMNELKAVYGWTDRDLEETPWLEVQEELYVVLDAATGRHFSIERKVSTVAWAYHVARQRVSHRMQD